MILHSYISLPEHVVVNEQSKHYFSSRGTKNVAEWFASGAQLKITTGEGRTCDGRNTRNSKNSWNYVESFSLGHVQLAWRSIWFRLKIWHTPKIQWCRPHFPSGRMALTCGQITPSSGDHLVGDSEYIPIPPTIHWFPPVPYIPSLSPLTHASVARVCMRISPASSTACCSAGCPTRWSMPSSEGRCRRSGSSFAPRQQTPIGWNVRFLFCAANFGILWILSDFKWS